MLLTDIYDKEKDCIEYNSKVLMLDMSFDNVLRFFDMMDDEDMSSENKVTLGLEILIRNEEDLNNFTLFDLYELFKFIVYEFLGYDISNNGNDDQKHKDEDEKPKKVLDINKDADAIYASFLYAYNMDLFEMQGVLHWDRFVALLSNIPKDTPFSDIVGYRQMKVPSGKHVDQEYVKHVKRMKRIYSLEEDKTMDDGLDALSRAMKGR